MILTGTLVNTGTILAGSALGLLLGKAIPQRLSDSIIKGLGLCTIFLGISGLSDGENPLITILSMALGVTLGELLRLDERLNRLGERIQAKLAAKTGGSVGTVAEGFVTASLLFCVGAMTVMGSLQSGLSGDHKTLFAKATLDFVSALIFASSLGVGVMLAAGSVFVIQGSITLLASAVAPYLQASVGEMNCVGSLLLLALGLNLIGVTKFRVMNYVPAIFIPILLCTFM